MSDQGTGTGTGGGRQGDLDPREWEELEAARVRGAARAVRGMLAGTLSLEAFTVLLVPATVAKFGSGLTTAKLTVTVMLAAALVVAAFLLRRAWGIAVASALQLAIVASGLLTAAMYVLGVIYGLIWLYGLQVRRNLLTVRPPPAR